MRKGLFIISFLLAGVTFGQAEIAGPVSLEGITIPKSLGKINERFSGSDNSRWIVQIQDVHAHFTAHENMAAIIAHLNRDYGLETIALEGGWSETSLPHSRAMEPSRQKQMLARSLLEDAHIGGPVYAALFSKAPLHIVGIEDAPVYNENLDIYLRHIKERPLTLSRLTAIEKDIRTQKVSVYNSALLRFDESLNSFREGKKAEEFLPDLIKQAAEKNVDLSAFEQVFLFKEILGREKKINKEKLHKEAERLMQDHQGSRASFEELLRNGKIPEEKLRFYPEANNYLQLMRLQSQIEHGKFFHQIDRVIEVIQQSLVQNERERELVAKAARLYTAKTLILMRATPDDLRVYEENKKEIYDDLKRSGLSEALQLSLNFYAIAKQRDRIFFEKLISDKKLGGNVIAVTGGFHTEGLSALLRKSNISYVVITPELGETEHDESLYFQRLLDNVPVTQTLSHEKNRYVFLDANFPDGVEILKRTNNVTKAVETATRYRLSASEGRIGTQTAADALDHEKFTSFPKDKRQKIVRKLFRSAQQSRKPIAIVLKTSTLAALLKDPVGEVLWTEVVAPDSSNRVVIVRDSNEFLEATIGISARVDRVNRSSKIEEVLQSRLRNQSDIAVIDDEFFKNSASVKILALPEDPVALVLARVLLESGPSQMVIENNLLEDFRQELLEVFKTDGLIRQYA